jgi:ABC-type transporter Mla MlaB component
MLRITSQNKADGGVALKLEGNLCGVWVSELLTSWRDATCASHGRTVDIDLTSVNQLDTAAEFLLALIYRSGGHLVGSGVRMNELIRTIETEWPLAQMDRN